MHRACAQARSTPKVSCRASTASDSKTRRLGSSTTRRLDASTTRILDASIPRFLGSSNPRLLESSIPRRLDDSIPRFLDGSTTRCLESSNPRCLESSMPRILEPSMPRRLTLRVSYPPTLLLSYPLLPYPPTLILSASDSPTHTQHSIAYHTPHPSIHPYTYTYTFPPSHHPPSPHRHIVTPAYATRSRETGTPGRGTRVCTWRAGGGRREPGAGATRRGESSVRSEERASRPPVHAAVAVNDGLDLVAIDALVERSAGSAGGPRGGRANKKLTSSPQHSQSGSHPDSNPHP